MRPELIPNPKIIKPSILLISAGRTGTLFFSRMFRQCVSQIDSFHMPDKISDYRSLASWKEQFNNFGVVNSTFKRLTGKFGMRFVSDKALSGRLGRQKCIDLLYQHRYRFVMRQPHLYYAESNPTLYGVISCINEVWDNARVIYVVRNGYDWVRSHFNWGAWYGENKFMNLLVRRLEPDFLNSDPYWSCWKNFSRFEKLCWAWYRINSKAWKDIQNMKNARWFKFEAIFHQESDNSRFKELLNFAFESIDKAHYCIDDCLAMRGKKVHRSKNQALSTPDQWSKEMLSAFRKLCGNLMESLNYKVL
jgi:hypothetical protein